MRRPRRIVRPRDNLSVTDAESTALEISSTANARSWRRRVKKRLRNVVQYLPCGRRRHPEPCELAYRIEEIEPLSETGSLEKTISEDGIDLGLPSDDLADDTTTHETRDRWLLQPHPECTTHKNEFSVIFQKLDQLTQEVEKISKKLEENLSLNSLVENPFSSFRRNIQYFSCCTSDAEEHDDRNLPSPREYARTPCETITETRTPDEHDDVSAASFSSAIYDGSCNRTIPEYLLEQVDELMKYADRYPKSADKSEIMEIVSEMEEAVNKLPKPSSDCNRQILRSPSFINSSYPLTPAQSKKEAKRKPRKEYYEMKEISPRVSSDYSDDYDDTAT